MIGKEAILDSIVSNAEAAAKELLSAAMSEKEEKLAAEIAGLAAGEEKERANAEAEAALVLSRRAAGSRLAASKVILAAKQKQLDSVYAAAKQRILNMTDPVYREFIGDYILKYAEDGDSLVLAARDLHKVTPEFIQSLAVKKKIALALSGKTHTDDGGVILHGKKCDKNLTLSALLSDAREKTESAVAEKLFGK